ncbi:Complex I intermediate-associated protein [Gracilaria domingensis]|nr:Complex I intermediate-associated protein [Gracilaria domingensis]
MYAFVPPGQLRFKGKSDHFRTGYPQKEYRRGNCVVASARRLPWPFTRHMQTQLLYSSMGKLTSRTAKESLPERTARHLRQCKDGVFLVTGASGRTGSRVVRNLLLAKKRVRALTRDRERLIQAMEKLDIDVKEEERAGRLEVYKADLFNLSSDIFEDVMRIASCTGTTYRATSNTENGSSPGASRESPLSLENKPENVEYIGIQNLVHEARRHFSRMEANGNSISLLDFSDTASVNSQWSPVNDVVMGGVSRSTVQSNNGELVFAGSVSTENNGGFASARMFDLKTPMNLSGYDGLLLRVRGDGNQYKMIVRCEPKWDGLSHCFTFETTKDEWVDVKIPFQRFNSTRRAKTAEDAPALNPANIVAFQLMLSKFEYDGELNPTFTPGSFKLRVSDISAYVNESSAGCPKLVHIGTAATTRTLRKNEFKEQIPIVQLSDKLGRILDWKLAGEDAIRTSGIPYCVLRSTGLNDDTGPVGIENLFFDQGDFLTGNISRDDLAALLVEAFSKPVFTNVTTEISSRKKGQELRSLEEQLQNLKVDDELQRKFASFPYIPNRTPVPQ